MDSTKAKLSLALKPKDTVNTVFKENGRLLKAKSVGELPRSGDQEYYLQKKLQQKAIANSIDSSVGGEAHDMLYAVMLQCKSMEGCERFVQDLTCALEPMAVLATGQQLFDMERFCCDPFKFCIVGIDLTFNLGELNITPIVYRHLLLNTTMHH